MRIGLRVCVNSLQGALEGVPNLLKLFDTYKIQATFFFALGPDRSGRLFGVNPDLQPWHRQRTLFSRVYATLVPPIMANRVRDVLRAVDNAGHETGLLSYDPVDWVSQAAFAEKAWTREMLMNAIGAYESALGKSPLCHAAAGWQVNPHLLILEQEIALKYASDVRGKHIFLPHLQGVDSACPQIPTTLPAVTDLLNVGGDVTPKNVHEYLYADSQYILPHGHVYSLDAELEGLTLLPLMEKLVVMWKGYGEGLTTLGVLHDAADKAQLPRHQIGWAQEDGLDCYLARQSLPR